jgi:hypothetical protein
MAIAQRKHAPGGLDSVAEEEDGGFSWLMMNSFGTSCPSPSVTGMVPCLIFVCHNRNVVMYVISNVDILN